MEKFAKAMDWLVEQIILSPTGLLFLGLFKLIRWIVRKVKRGVSA